MPTAHTSELLDLLAESVTLPDSMEGLRASYRNAKPFPHVVLDNLFAAPILERLAQESTAMPENRLVNVATDGLEKTIRMNSAVYMGASGRDFVALLHSAAFLYLLSELTGIWQLLPDPYLQGGGHALMRRGGYFNVHADRSVAYDTGLTRRLAMIVFLNKDWRAEYGGQLELWNSTATRCEARIEPVFNKTIIFEVAYPNYHGVPAPLTCPEDQARKSFIVYYHTVGIDERQSVKPHSSLFVPGFYQPKKTPLHRLAKQVTPPILVPTLRKLRGWLGK